MGMWEVMQEGLEVLHGFLSTYIVLYIRAM